MNSHTEPYYQYLANVDGYVAHAYAALSSHFSSEDAVRQYLGKLRSDSDRNEFLRVSSFYRGLVKDGDWVSRFGSADPTVIDYLTETYKAVALFSLIESVSGEKHQDFFEWLMQEKRWPVDGPDQLKELHTEYKATFGSIRRCIWFFQQMSTSRQAALCKAVRVEQKPMDSIEAVAKFLYDLRSKFVHEARLVLELSDGVMISKVNKKISACEVALTDLTSAFEEGVIKVFRERT